MRKLIIFPALVLFALGSCKNSGYEATEINGERIAVDNGIESDSAIIHFIKPFSEHINRNLDSIVAFNPSNLNKSDGELNTALGNLMADIVMQQANSVFKSRTGNEIDIVLLNHGGIRSTIDKGPVSARSAYKLMPFENEIVVAELTGAKVNEMLSYLETNRTAHPVGGINIEMDNDYRIINATVNGEPIKEDDTYFVATSDYLQQGGDSMNFFKDPVELYLIDYKLRNAIIDYFHKIDTIQVSRDNRYIRITE